MTRGESRLLRAAHWTVALTGLAWAWMIYFAEPADPYSAVNHPWQPTMQASHILAAPVLILAVGLIWKPHVWSHFRAGMRSRRKTGILLALLFLPMAASGYLLQVAVEESSRAIWSGTHLAASVVWVGVWLMHRWARAHRWIQERDHRAVSGE